jgi:hypothetical protein
MLFGIITPVFDGCLDSLELLFRDLRRQTHRDWIWLLSSNGYSRKMSDFAREKSRMLEEDNKKPSGALPRVIYSFLPREAESDPYALLANIGKRRGHCIKRLDADLIFMIDADSQLLDDRMFRAVDVRMRLAPRKGLCVYRIEHVAGILPKFPIEFGRIDMLNFCMRAGLAKKIGYPDTVNREMPANDYWYFERAYREVKGDILFIDRVFGRHNGHSTYVNAIRLLRPCN